MPTRKITIEVDEEGKVRMLFSGFKGNECFRVASDVLERLKAIGVALNVEKVVKTPEAYEEERQTNVTKEPTSLGGV